MTDGISPALRPFPLQDSSSEPFFRALEKRMLMIQRCTGCGSTQIGESSCRHCESASLDWIESSGLATLYSFTIVHIAYHPSFSAGVPYNAAIVELAEGPRLFSNIIGCANEDLRIGMELTVEFVSNGPGYLPDFRPLEQAPGAEQGAWQQHGHFTARRASA